VSPGRRPSSIPVSDDPPDDWRSQVWALATHVPPASKPAVLARAVLLAGLGVWSLRFFAHSLEAGYLFASFMHVIHLPFHEAGHILFMPFGRFLTSLGGSLTQVLVPLVCLGTFLLKTRDTFGAAVALWWAGQSLMDLGPYIADARALRIVLLGGRTGGVVAGHDWEAILGTLGWLRYDVVLGRIASFTGSLLMLAALAWGGWVILRQYQERENPEVG
jgi:hypothetical protein